jgi:ribose/xylose/arabinose/galactoside ABC-type transport system permease subunit|tara:strand:+ start:20 stop:307 length:288 start_codon:yes stop_codon:yes gene_type:complete
VLDVRSLDLNFYLVVAFVLLVVKIFAFVNSLMHSNQEYEAAGKLTKTAWTLILGLGVVVQLLLGGPLGLLNIVFTIAAFVYLADVRPAIAGLRRR